MTEYAKRDLMELGHHYSRHVAAMTSEHLNSKSDIAAELAWRDKMIAELRGECMELRSALNVKTPVCVECGDGITEHDPGICGTCYATKYEDVEKTRVLEYAVVKWLMDSHTGLSSRCMAFWLTWHVHGEDPHHPFDPSDLTRCLLLLQAVPQLRERVPEMAQLSPTWDALVRRWTALEASLISEVGDLQWSRTNRAPQTYAMMRGILDGVGPKP